MKKRTLTLLLALFLFGAPSVLADDGIMQSGFNEGIIQTGLTDGIIHGDLTNGIILIGLTNGLILPW